MSLEQIFFEAGTNTGCGFVEMPGSIRWLRESIINRFLVLFHSLTLVDWHRLLPFSFLLQSLFLFTLHLSPSVVLFPTVAAAVAVPFLPVVVVLFPPAVDFPLPMALAFASYLLLVFDIDKQYRSQKSCYSGLSHGKTKVGGSRKNSTWNPFWNPRIKNTMKLLWVAYGYMIEHGVSLWLRRLRGRPEELRKVSPRKLSMLSLDPANSHFQMPRGWTDALIPFTPFL